MTADPSAHKAFRGWSHFALQHAEIGWDGDEFWHRAGAAVVFLPSSGGWRYSELMERHVAALVEDQSAEVWQALLAHDVCLYGRGLVGPRDFKARAYLRASQAVLGESLREALARIEAQPHIQGRRLHGPAEIAWIHLAARLGPALLRWLDDGRGADQTLRVCEMTSIVFRATRRRVFHPGLPPAAKRPLRGEIKRVGTRFPPTEPFAAWALARWEQKTCAECGAGFEAAHAATVMCQRCASGAERVRRSRSVLR